MYELDEARKVLPRSDGYYHPIPITAGMDLRSMGAEDFAKTYKIHIALCIRELPDSRLKELQLAYSPKNWDKITSLSPKEITDFMLTHKTVGSFLLQARNDERLVVRNGGYVNGQFEWFHQPPDQTRRYAPTDDQIRAYLDIETSEIALELQRRESGELDWLDILHYQHLLLRQGRYPTMPKSWLGRENVVSDPELGFVEVYREPPFFVPEEVEVFDFCKQRAVIAQMISILKNGYGESLCTEVPMDSESPMEGVYRNLLNITIT